MDRKSGTNLQYCACRYLLYVITSKCTISCPPARLIPYGLCLQTLRKILQVRRSSAFRHYVRNSIGRSRRVAYIIWLLVGTRSLGKVCTPGTDLERSSNECLLRLPTDLPRVKLSIQQVFGTPACLSSNYVKPVNGIEEPQRCCLNLRIQYFEVTTTFGVQNHNEQTYFEVALNNMAQSALSGVSSVAGGPGSFQMYLESYDIKIVAVEEHVAYPELFHNSGIENHATQRLGARFSQIGKSYTSERLGTTADLRLWDMDKNGVSVQILGLGGPVNSTHFVGDKAAQGTAIARDANNKIKKAVDIDPSRFKAFAELPMQVPDEAVRELRRCVTELGFVGAMLSGTVSGEGVFLDAPEFDPLLSAFEELDVPLYLHPGVPPRAVWDAYYDIPGKPEISTRFGLGGWGWHNDVAVHTLRLVLSGTLERHPRLKVIIGHQGEMIPAMLGRLEQVFDPKAFGLKRSVAQTLRSQVWIVISGFFDLALTQMTIATWGVDRVMFGVDYPFAKMDKVPEYVRALGEILSTEDLRKVLQKNAEDLLKFQA